MLVVAKEDRPEDSINSRKRVICGLFGAKVRTAAKKKHFVQNQRN
jgi:hypothetical protein